MQKVLSQDRPKHSDANVATELPLRAISQRAAYVSFGAAAFFLVLLAVLHVVKPEFEPSWRFVSEYAIGRHGWIMVLAFMSLAVSCTALVPAIRSQIETTGGRIGLILLLVVAVSLIVAGIFVADPITAGQDQLTTHGNLHGLAASVGIPGLPIAALLISRSLSRNPAWSAARLIVRLTAHLTWISVLLMSVSMFVLLNKSQGKFGPDVLIGWPNRLVVLSYCAWLMVVSWHSSRLSLKSSRDVRA